MELYVIRHGIAEDPRHGLDDADRALTSDGEKRFRREVRGLRKLDVAFDRVLTSPWARALATATLLAPIGEDKPQITDLLAQPPRAELLALISERRAGSSEGSDTTAVVGHEPWLSELVAWLAFGDTRHGEALTLKKGGVVWLEGSAVPGGMTLRGLLPPGVIRSIR